MLTYFVDASALVKRYNRRERGSGIVRGIFDDRGARRLVISPCITEVLHAFCRLAFEGQITVKERDHYIARLAADVLEGLITVYSPTGSDALESGEVAKRAFALATVKKRPGPLDSLAIACGQRFARLGMKLISSDKDLNRLAKLFHFQIIDPEEP